MQRYWTKDHYWIRFQMWFTTSKMPIDRWHEHFCWLPVTTRIFDSDWYLPNRTFQDKRFWMTWVQRRWVNSMVGGYWQYRRLEDAELPWEDEVGPRGERYDSFKEGN